MVIVYNKSLSSTFETKTYIGYKINRKVWLQKGEKQELEKEVEDKYEIVNITTEEVNM